MTHCSNFLLPPSPSLVESDNSSSSRTYALVVLNQRLPRYTPLLWTHGTNLLLWLYFIWFLCFNSVNFFVEQHVYVYVLMEARIACSMNCLFFFRRKMLLKFGKGSLIYVFFFFVFAFQFQKLHNFYTMSIPSVFSFCFVRFTLFFAPLVQWLCGKLARDLLN